jgi:CheY-like chemotaxis protein
VTDIAMPKMDGIELVTTWRREESSAGRRRTPAVVLTAHVTQEYQVQCRQAGVDVFLTKPIKGVALRRALAKIGHGVGRILILDPADESRHSMETCLDNFALPLRIESVRSQKEALAACLREKFSIVFIQLDTAYYKGDEVLMEIRSLPGLLEVPCIGYGEPISSLQSGSVSKIGFSETLRRPTDRQVHRLVRQYLRAATIDVRAATSLMRLPRNDPTLLELTLPSSALKVELDPDTRELLPEFFQGLRESLSELSDLIEAQQFSIVGAVGTNMRVSGRLHRFEEVSTIGSRQANRGLADCAERWASSTLQPCPR